MVDRNSELPRILSNYIAQRDGFRKQSQFDINHKPITIGLISQFDTFINSFATQVSDELPDLSIAQWEALIELASSRLSFMRNRN